MRFWCKGVATTHLALGVITVLIMFGPAVEAQAQVPDRPELYTVHPGHRYLTVSVESRGSVVPPTSFKLQWKSGNQDYDTSRQKINSVTPNDNDVDNAERTTFWLLGLTNGVEYSFRAFATNEHGDSPPSFQRTGTPFYPPDKDASLWSLRYYYDSEYKGDFLEPQVLGEAQERVHSVVVRPSTESITILALPQYQGESNRPGATVEYDPADADDTARFHQTSLIEGENVITVTVTSADRSTTSTHTITVTRPSVATQPSNLEPTGLPTIAGTARVGETLTASVSEIADSDGLGGATFTYQWIRSDGATDTEIADATQASYTLVPTDQGKTIKVRATFTDDGGTEEALTSAATAVVQDSPLLSVSDARATEGALVEFTVSLSAASGQQVTVQYATADGTAESGADFTPASGTLTFAANETSKSVYVATGRDAVDEENETFTLRLSNASGASIADGEATGTISDEESPFVSVPQIDGIPQVGNTLEVSFADPPSGALAYQWLRGSEVIAGATASTHVPTVADLGARLSVRVESGGDSVTSKATAPVWPAPANPPLADGEEELLSATVTLGSHQFPYWVAGYGRVLGESFGEMDVTSFEDGGATYAVDSFLVNSSGVFGLSTGSTLPDASGLVAYWNGYRISGLDEDAVKRGKLPMLVGRTPQPSTEYSRYEDGASDGVQVAVSLRRVSAEAQNALTASFEDVPVAHDGESAFRFRVAFSEPIAISFRSLREDAFETTGGRVTRGTRVDGRKDLFEITVEPDGDGELTIALPAGRDCAVSGAICTWGPPRKRLTNTPTATVAGPDRAPANASAEGAPTIAGTPRVGGTLSASTSGITDADGLDDARFAYQWIRANSDIQGVTGSTYTAVEADEGERLKVRVSFTDDAGNAESLTSAATDAVAARPEPLTASFEDVPAAHDGESAFRFRVAFSEPIAISFRSLREDAFETTGGRVTRGTRVDGRKDLFEITVEPDGDGELTIALPAGRDCAVSGAICTWGPPRKRLTNTPTATVAGPDRAPANASAEGAPTIAGTPRVGGTLSASTSGITDADGLDDARFAYQWIRANSDIQGVTGSTYTAVEADEGERLKVRVSFTDDAGNAESLTSAATDAVAARPEPLTASFEDVPAAHDGESAFTLRIASSDRLSMMNGQRLREDVVAVSGGRATSAGRVNRRRDLWRLTVEPDSLADVTVTLAAGAACDSPAAVCTKDGRALSNTISATVRGPVGISVADAHVEEDAGAVLAFAVTLSRAASRALTVDYATSDGSAQAGVDYTAASGTLTFQAGESSRTIEVEVLDDAHDEGEETLTLTLSSASGGRLTDGDATGTIENRDPLPRALLARFGRTAAVHVVEHVEERLAAPRELGFRGRFAGRELRRGMESEMALNFLRQLGGAASAGPRGTGPMGAGVGGPMGGSPAAGTAPRGMPGASGGGALMMGVGGPISGAAGMARGGGLNGGGFLQMGLGGGDLLTGSDFAMNRESRGGILSFWSRGAQSRFSGREGALSLGGDVRTTMFGADYARGPLVAGLSLSNSRGLGEYAGAAGGQVASSVTGLYPWLGYKMTERVTVWGVAGYGTGGLRLTPDSGQALESGLSMAMAAAGTRGELVAGGSNGFELAFKADVLWVGTAIDGVDGPAGRLKATDAAVTRFRTGLESSRAYTLAGRLSLTPSVEVGLRHDGGDAETGAGMDVGAGLVVSDAGTGLAVDVRVRTLLVHQDEDFSERGVAVSLSYNPTPSTPLGFLAKVAPSWGGQATSGAEALWGRETMAGMAHGGVAQGNSLDAEVGYGLPVGSRFVGTPKFGLRTSEHGRDYRLGYSLGALSRERLALELGVEAQRRENPMLGGASNGVLGRASLGW